MSKQTCNACIEKPTTATAKNGEKKLFCPLEDAYMFNCCKHPDFLTIEQCNQPRHTIIKAKAWVKCYDGKQRRIVLVSWHDTKADIDTQRKNGNMILYDQIGRVRDYATHEEEIVRGFIHSEYFRVQDLEGAIHNFDTRSVGDRGKYKTLTSLIQ